MTKLKIIPNTSKESLNATMRANECYKPLFFAEQFDLHFTSEKFKTSRENNFRHRYEVTMAQIDFWINSLGLEISNDFTNDGQKFKNGMFYHLKKMGWKTTDIKGRWKKVILL